VSADRSRLPRPTAAARARMRGAAEGRDGRYLLEGVKAVGDALAREGTPVHEAWIADDLPDEKASPLVSAAVARRIPIGRLQRDDVDRESGTASPQGALAIVSDLATTPAAVLRARGLVLLLDRVQDPGNVGAVFRVAAAFAAAGVLVAEGSADPLRQKALRASAGTALAVPFARGSLSDALAAARDAGRPVWLLDAEGDDLFAAGAAPAGVVLAVGSEGTGASATVRDAAARRIAIPIARGVESLNAAVAVGIAVAVLSRAAAAPAAGTAPAPRAASPARGRRP
jgi:tRNA G18 (ribose-2'-O)-methylase SpoU